MFARANHGLLPGDDPVMDPTSTDNHMEMKREAEQMNVHRMAMVDDFLEMWQGSHNLQATQKESHAQNKQMAAVRYISGTEVIINASWSHCQYDSVAAFKLTEKSPVAAALSAKDLPAGQTQVLNVHQIKQIDRHPAKSDEDSSPARISDTGNWLNWNGDL